MNAVDNIVLYSTKSLEFEFNLKALEFCGIIIPLKKRVTNFRIFWLFATLFVATSICLLAVHYNYMHSDDTVHAFWAIMLASSIMQAHYRRMYLLCKREDLSWLMNFIASKYAFHIN